MSHRWKTLKISSHIFFSRRLYFGSARLISHGWVCVQSRTFLTYYWIIVSCRCRSTEPALDCDSLRHHDWHWCSHMRNRPEPKANATYILWTSPSFLFFRLRIKRLLTSAKILHLFCAGRVFLDRLSPSSRYLFAWNLLGNFEHATRDSRMRCGTTTRNTSSNAPKISSFMRHSCRVSHTAKHKTRGVRNALAFRHPTTIIRNQI